MDSSLDLLDKEPPLKSIMSQLNQIWPLQNLLPLKGV